MMELDPVLKNGLKLLHSNDNTSAEKLRLAIDDIISQKYGPSKLLSSILSKKYLNEESNAVGSNLVAVKRPKIEKKPRELEESVESVEDDHLKELEDLFCKNCKRMDVSARNRLVECSDCHSLYHQECHQPPISETDANDQENSWYCFTCKEKAISKASSTNSSPAKSSSSSSTSSSYTKNYESSSSSSKKSKEKVIPPAVVATTTSSGSTTTPSINIVSADKRIQNMKKKAAQRKHK
ncbi:integrator complex subunit 12 [Culicoides brevitarsis]|uniref:integrator complex subunit 12 n=1 Tax=Culicoides brevitarsis TaxID=469753 RepID=UPI00307C288C